MDSFFNMGNLILYGVPLAGIFSLLMVFVNSKLLSKPKSGAEKKQEKTTRDIRVKNIKERQKEIDNIVKVIENENTVSEGTKKQIEEIMENTVTKISEIEEVDSISGLWDEFKK